jgi:hypothetical protein
LEIKEAMEQRKPIVLLQLSGPGQSFSFEDAFALLNDLEGKMPSRNPYCLDELRHHLGDMPMTEFQQILCTALENGRAMTTHVPHLNINGTSNHLEAELVDLVECLAVATGRTCEWQNNHRVTELHQSTSLWALTKPLRRPSATAESCVAIVYEPDAAAHAARLREGMERTLKQQCNIHVPLTVEAMVLSLGTMVASSRYVLLVQTRGVLSQPWALLAVYFAAHARIPIVCVVVDHSGYDFANAKQHLEQLGERLDAASLEQLTTALSHLSPPHDMPALQKTIASSIPHIISVVYHPEGSDHKLAATVRDVRDKHRLLAKSREASDKKMFRLELFKHLTPKRFAQMRGRARFPRMPQPHRAEMESASAEGE